MSGSDFEREPDSDRESSERASASTAALPTAHTQPMATLLRMQQDAGNRAVAKLIRESRRTLAREKDPYDRSVTRWVKLEPPSVVLNSPSVTKIKLTRSPVIPWDMSAHKMLAKHVKAGDRHLVFNCHGFATKPDFDTPHLSIGTAVHPGNVSAFSQPHLRGLNVIWISACNVASSAQGDDFCKQIARNAGCYVVAPVMSVTQNVKKGHIEDTAGAMWKYIDPNGDWISRNKFIALGPKLGFAYQKKSK